jgi:hypothetical protein
MSHILRVFGIPALFGMLAASWGTANAATFKLNSAPPYVCMSSNGDGTANGTAVITYSCAGGPGQTKRRSIRVRHVHAQGSEASADAGIYIRIRSQ